MTELEQKILIYLNPYIEQNVTNLMRKTDYHNKNYFVQTLDSLEEQGIIESRRDGRERLIKLPDPEPETVNFLENYGGTLKDYGEFLKKHLKRLEKTMPLVPDTDFPMKRIKTREPRLTLDKKDNTYRDLGKTQAGHAYTWKTSKKPLEHFSAILNALNKLYQESSAISFSEFITKDSSIKKYQKETKKLINGTLDELERILKKDIRSWSYGHFYITRTLHGLIHQMILDKKRAKLL